MQYWGQKDSKYADCSPRAVANACVFYGLPCPDPTTEAWEDVVEFTGCRHGTAVKEIDEIAEHFGLRATKIPVNQAMGQLPVVLTVYNPEIGHSLHCVLIVGWRDNVATVVDYRVNDGPLVERLPLRLGKQPPERTDGALNRDLQWNALYVPPPPNDRCYLLEPA
jgi:hypothetical protein